MVYTNNLGQTRVGVRNQSVVTSLLLDIYSGSAAAYSLRKLSNSYSGSAVRVRRSSDNTELNIGFDGGGDLDTASLLSFVGANNTALYSEEFDNAWWTKNNVTVTPNQTIAPDGTMTADLLSESGTLNHSIFNSTGISWTAGISWSWNMSVYVKKGPGTAAPNTFALSWSGGNIIREDPYVLFNISTGTIVEVQPNSSDSNFGYSITPVGDGWFRCAMWGTFTPSVTANRYTAGVIRFNANLNTITTAYYTGNTQANMYIWGWQFVRKANDTSVLTTQPYIKTGATAAGNGFVSTWYDQSGNGVNLTQATAAVQPRIVAAGVIHTLNGKAGLYNTSSSVTSPNRMSVNFGTTLSQPNTMFILGSSNFTSGGGTIIDGIVNGSRNSLSALDATKLYIFAGSLVQLNYTANSNTQRLLYGKFSTTTSAIAVNNGTAATGNIGTQSLTGITINSSYTGGNGSTLNYQQEIIIWNDDKSADRVGISNDINTYYSTY